MKARRRADAARPKVPVQVASEQVLTVAKPRRKELWAACGLVAITLLAYSNSFHAGFTLDNSVLLHQEQIKESSSRNIGLIFAHTYWWPVVETGLYRPLVTLSFLFNYAVLGNADNPAGYHWINFLIHAINMLLAFAVLLKGIRKFWPSVFAAGLWAVHPVLTESVTNIVGRADLLAAMSILGGFLIYLHSKEVRGWRKLPWLVALFAVTTIGVFSKENAVTILGVIAVYELAWWKERGSVRDLAAGAVAVLLPIAAFLYQRWAVLSASPAAVIPFVDNPLVGAGFWTGRFTALKIMAKYLALLVWPARLASDYSWAQIPFIRATAADWIPVLTVLSLGGILLILFRPQREMFFFGVLAFGTFLPGSNLLFPIGTIMAERLLYLPAFGLIVCLVLTVLWVGERVHVRDFGPAILVVAILACTVRTWARNPDWNNDRTLAEATVRASPRSFKAHILLARARYAADSAHSNIDRVIEEGERGVTLLNPLPDSQNVWTAYRELGGYYLVKGDASAGKPAWLRSIQLLNRAISIIEAQPAALAADGGVVVPLDLAEAYRTLSGAWLRLSESTRAYNAAVHARDLNPASSDGYRALANALRASGRDEEAITALMEGQMLTSDPSLSPEMVAIYRSRHDPGCTLIQGPNGPEPDPHCPIVHDDICTAVAGAMRIQLRMHRQREANVMMDRAETVYGCAPGPLEKLLQGLRP